MMKTYTEALKYVTFEDRFNYLKLSGDVGQDTFGFDRWLNQNFYRSDLWRGIRDTVIIRDGGFDLAMDGYLITDKIIIHHINPITKSDILNQTDLLLNPDYLICVSHRTHNALHYGDISILTVDPVERKPGDTKLW
ncbi:MAG: hypothetical protein J6Y02_00975 [Pseudobutyrivibrio sp.]|nr:hypothetical protein [Pseudobutyrivibrio sp.]